MVSHDFDPYRYESAVQGDISPQHSSLVRAAVLGCASLAVSALGALPPSPSTQQFGCELHSAQQWPAKVGQARLYFENDLNLGDGDSGRIRFRIQRAMFGLAGVRPRPEQYGEDIYYGLADFEERSEQNLSGFMAVVPENRSDVYAVTATALSSERTDTCFALMYDASSRSFSLLPG